ncbi:TPA: hypothetical protein SMN38_000589 [Proteus mirabilis]|nr:hypothetical protein [Proteus mirabilis]
MIRCVRLWTGEDGNSLFEEGIIEFKDSSRDEPWRRAYVVYKEDAGLCFKPTKTTK